MACESWPVVSSVLLGILCHLLRFADKPVKPHMNQATSADLDLLTGNVFEFPCLLSHWRAPEATEKRAREPNEDIKEPVTCRTSKPHSQISTPSAKGQGKKDCKKELVHEVGEGVVSAVSAGTLNVVPLDIAVVVMVALYYPGHEPCQNVRTHDCEVCVWKRHDACSMVGVCGPSLPEAHGAESRIEVVTCEGASEGVAKIGVQTLFGRNRIWQTVALLCDPEEIYKSNKAVEDGGQHKVPWAVKIIVAIVDML